MLYSNIELDNHGNEIVRYEPDLPKDSSNVTSHPRRYTFRVRSTKFMRDQLSEYCFERPYLASPQPNTLQANIGRFDRMVVLYIIEGILKFSRALSTQQMLLLKVHENSLKNHPENDYPQIFQIRDTFAWQYSEMQVALESSEPKIEFDLEFQLWETITYLSFPNFLKIDAKDRLVVGDPVNYSAWADRVAVGCPELALTLNLILETVDLPRVNW